MTLGPGKVMTLMSVYVCTNRYHPGANEADMERRAGGDRDGPV